MAQSHPQFQPQFPFQLRALPWMQASTDQISQLWQQRKLPHALCLQAGQGFGKKHQLRFLVHLLMCKKNNTSNLDSSSGEDNTHNIPDKKYLSACGECQHCILLRNDEHPDFFAVTTSGKSGQIGIDQIRQIHDFSMTTAYLAPMRLVVIDELERLTLAAANALLKHLEEPPPNVYFLLSTAKPSQLMPTVRSRLQFFSIQSPALTEFQEWIETVIEQTVEVNSLKLSFELAQSGPFGALTWLLTHLKVEKAPGGLLVEIDSKSADLLADYQRLLDCMSQSPKAAKMHLSVQVQTLTLDQSSLLFELWLQRELTLDSAGLLATDRLELLWQALLQIHEIRQQLALSPQLNETHLKRRLLKIWFSCNLGKLT